MGYLLTINYLVIRTLFLSFVLFVRYPIDLYIENENYEICRSVAYLRFKCSDLEIPRSVGRYTYLELRSTSSWVRRPSAAAKRRRPPTGSTPQSIRITIANNWNLRPLKKSTATKSPVWHLALAASGGRIAGSRGAAALSICWVNK